MSRLWIIASPSTVAGYGLAGSDVHAAHSAADAAHHLRRLLAEREEGLVAIEERLLAGVDPALLQSLEAYRLLPLLPIPSGEPAPPGVESRARIADLIREAVGYHITFAGEER